MTDKTTQPPADDSEPVPELVEVLRRVAPWDRTCFVCAERDAKGVGLCSECSKSYDQHVSQDDGTVMSIIRWAAERAREFERKRRQE